MESIGLILGGASRKFYSSFEKVRFKYRCVHRLEAYQINNFIVISNDSFLGGFRKSNGPMI